MVGSNMAAAAVQDRTSYAEYLAIDDASAAKHELIDGVVYAMSGGSPEHVLAGTSDDEKQLGSRRPG